MKKTGSLRVCLCLALSTLFFLLMRPGSGQGQEVPKIKIGEIHNIHLSLPTYIALANGYFREEGLDVQVIDLAGGAKVREALIAGEINLALIGLSTIAIALDKGVPVKVILSTHEREIFSLIARTALKDKIRTVKDLKGKNVGIVAFGTAMWVYAQYFLKNAGLDPEKDVKLIPVGVGLPMYTALETAKVDATISDEPVTTRAIKEKLAFPLISIWKPEEHNKWIGEKALSMVLVAMEGYIKEKPGLIQKTVNAHKKALAFIRTRTAPEVTSVAAPYWKGVPRELLEEIIEKAKPNYGDGTLSKKGYKTLMDIYLGAEVIKTAVPYEVAVDARFAGSSP